VTLRLSHQKVSLVLSRMFGGWPQRAVAEKVGVDQSTVSLWFSRFRARASQAGLSQAGKEFGIMNEVDSLRSLAVELFKNQLSVRDAREGLELVLAFSALGVPPQRHKDLVEICKKVQDPGFVSAALELCQLEAKEGMNYEQVIAQFKEMSPKVQHLKSERQALNSQLSALDKELADKKAELGALDTQLAERKKQAAAEEKKMEEGLKKKMENHKVTAQEVDMVSKLKAELGKKGLDLGVLVSLAKEFKHAK